jgi:cytochrome c2
MNRYINNQRFLFITIFAIALGFFAPANAQDGKQLFMDNCASCHNVIVKATGPALKGVEDRWPDQAKLYAWIRNNKAFLATGDKYANDLYIEYAKTAMTTFPNFKDNEIAAILKYINDYKDPNEGGGDKVLTEKKSGSNTLLFGLVTIILAVVGLILLQVNSNLKKLTDEKAGIATREPVPFWRNKTYIMAGTILFFIFGGYMTINGAIGLGRSKKYQPEQPIYYSHKVHAGVNQVNCLYCHGGAQESKHANIPSVNVCMNCHMAINEYSEKSEKLYREDGTEISGTAEINKLYEYAGFNPKENKPWDASKAKPIPWKQIHNLPDHVYFNHSQHVTAGKVQCQTCHGEIQKMGEVYQFAELSMGWCVNCHRETKVQFKDNGFYSMYEKYHNDIKNKKLDSAKGVTVEMIGGTECQKCHY